MLIDPAIAALRHDDRPQRQAQAAAIAAHDRWRAQVGIARIEAELRDLAAGASLPDLPRLSALMAEGDAALPPFLRTLLTSQAGVLREQPLAHVPLRHFIIDGAATLILAQGGLATLGIQVLSGAALARLAPPRSVCFAPTRSWDRVLAGTAQVRLFHASAATATRARLHWRDRMIAPGDVLQRQGRTAAMTYRAVPGSLVLLRLQSRYGQGEPAREYLIESGELVHQAAATPRDSRLELAAAVLGRMGRSDAAPLLAALAAAPGAEGLRWQCLREALALDSRTGFAALSGIAQDRADPLAEPAGALRTRLCAAWPQLEDA